MALFPKPLGDLNRVDIQVVPPGHFVASLVQLTMMAAAERNGELIADFQAQGSGLRKAQVMRIGRLTPTDKTGLRRNKPQMAFVTKAFGFCNRQNAFINLAREQIM